MLARLHVGIEKTGNSSIQTHLSKITKNASDAVFENHLGFGLENQRPVTYRFANYSLEFSRDRVVSDVRKSRHKKKILERSQSYLESAVPK